VSSLRIASLLAGLGALAAGGALLAPALAGRTDEPVRLDAVVGTDDRFEIALNDAEGKLVKRLAPGTYTVVVHDRSHIHNFHLASNEDRSVDFRTDLELVGDQSFTVTFKAGVRYVYACEPHWQTMFNDFFVDLAPTPPTTTTAPAAPSRTKLTATLTAAGGTTLRPGMVGRGPARITVRDRSARLGFRLAGPGIDRRTGRAFTGSAVWNVRLTPGTYRYGRAGAKLTNVLRVH
jgi:hypothetical protein